MVVRVSEGRFLEILESAPAQGVPIEIDVYSGADPATMLATLEGASEKSFQRELSELGGGSWKLWSHDPKATADILAEGNLVKFKLGGIDRHAAWIEERSRTVVATDEEGGELWSFACRGALAYLERAQVYPPIWPPAAASFVAGASADNGAGAGSLTIPKPAGTATGDVIVATVVCVGTEPATPAGWKRLRNVTNGTLRTLVYARRVVASEPASWSFFWSSAREATGAAVALRNASADDTAWAIADTTGSGSSIEEPSVSIPLVDGVLLGIAAKADNAAITPPVGMTETVDHAATDRSLEIAYEVGPAIGDSGDRTATGGGATDWIGISIWIPSTAEADVTFSGATLGAVLVTLIDAAQARGTIPHLTYDFDGTVDSHGEPWPDVHDLAFHVGTNLLEVWRHLVTLGLEGGMTPSLRLQAFVDAARHFEDTVVLRKGHHFTGDVVDTSHGAGRRSRMLVEGAGGRIVEVADPALEADGHIGRREGYLQVSTSDNPTTLQRAGEIALELTALEDEARSVAVVHGPAADGHYEPWVDYREGDWIGTDADGSGGAPSAERVVSITVEADDADYTVKLDLNSPDMDRETRLYRRLGALTRDTTAAGSGGAGGGGGAAAGRVGATATDTPGYLFDKLSVSGITKALVGDVGAQQVQLASPARPGVVGGYAPLDSGLLVPVAYLPTIPAGLLPALEDLSTAETDTAKVLKPDGAGGVAWGADATGGGGGGSGPAGIADAITWFIASDITGLADGATVTEWPNSAVSPNDAGQGRGSTPPIWKDAILNGHPVVRFGGAGHVAFTSLAFAAQGQTWAIVFKLTSLAPSYSGLIGNGCFADQGGMLVKSTGKLASYPLYALNAYYDGTGSHTLTTAGFHYLLLLAGPTTYDVRLDGSADGSGIAWAGSDGRSTAMLGNQYVGGRTMTGDVAEAVFYPRRLTSAEVTSLEAYFAARYGI